MPAYLYEYGSRRQRLCMAIVLMGFASGMSLWATQSLILLPGFVTVPMHEAELGVTVHHDYTADKCGPLKPDDLPTREELAESSVQVFDEIECIDYVRLPGHTYEDYAACTCTYQNQSEVTMQRGVPSFAATFHTLSPPGVCLVRAQQALQCISTWRASTTEAYQKDLRTLHCDLTHPADPCFDTPRILMTWNLPFLILGTLTFAFLIGGMTCDRRARRHHHQELQQEEGEKELPAAAAAAAAASSSSSSSSSDIPLLVAIPSSVLPTAVASPVPLS